MATFLFNVFIVKKRKTFHYAILFLLFLVGCLALTNRDVLSSDHISRVTDYSSKRIVAQGIISSEISDNKDKKSFSFAIKKIKSAQTWQSASGILLVHMYKPDHVARGDEVVVEGTLCRPLNFRISSRLYYREYLRRRGIYAVLFVKKKDYSEKISTGNVNWLIRSAASLKNKFKSVVSAHLSPIPASVINAVILGERSNLPKSIIDTLIKTGTVHIIAISGLHVGIVIFLILVILKIIRIPQRPRYIICIACCILYCLLTGGKVPVMRATLMAVFVLTAYIVKRESDMANSLSLAALCILWLNPRQLFEVSFQLSFLSVISICFLTPRVYGLFPERLREMRFARNLCLLFAASFSVWLGLCAHIIYYFKIISPCTIVANMIVVPFMTILVASGFALILCAITFPVCIPVFSGSTEFLTLILLKFLYYISRIPFAYFTIP